MLLKGPPDTAVLPQLFRDHGGVPPTRGIHVPRTRCLPRPLLEILAAPDEPRPRASPRHFPEGSAEEVLVAQIFEDR